MPATISRWQYFRDILLTTIEGQTGVGGQLDGIALVTKTLVSEANAFPYVGIQFERFAEAPMGNSGVHILKYQFLLSVAVRQPYSNEAPDTGLAALAAIDPFMNDGAGNGLETLLSGLADFGGCIRSGISEFEVNLLQPADASSGSVAMGLYRFEIDDEIRRFGA